MSSPSKAALKDRDFAALPFRDQLKRTIDIFYEGTKEELQDPSNPTIHAAAKLYNSMATALAGRPAVALHACRQGCAWCCYDVTFGTVPEILLLAEYLREGMSDKLPLLVDELRTHVAGTKGLKDVTAYKRARVACPFLDPQTRSCRVYDVRPMCCRIHISQDADACRKAIESPGGHPVPVDTVTHEAGKAMYIGYVAAIRDSKRTFANYDLIPALVRALTDTECDRRWRAGGDPFPGCRMALQA